MRADPFEDRRVRVCRRVGCADVGGDVDSWVPIIGSGWPDRVTVELPTYLSPADAADALRARGVATG